MANFTLVADSTFKPFTYQELVTPIAHQQQVMDQLADEYDKLSSQADILEAMGKNDKDKKSGVYSQYQAYSNALREEADNLYRNGLNYDSRMRLSDLRRRYNKEIVPIQNAWNERKQEADTQMKARLQNPSLRFTRDAANSSLEEYINNPMGGYGVVDLKTVTAQMAGMAKNLTKQIRGSKGQLEGIDQYTYDYIKKYGLDANIISDWIKNPDRSPALTNMMNQVLAANGLSSEEFRNSPNGASLLAEATNAAQMGAWEAIGEDKSQVIENWGARESRKEAHDVRMENLRTANAIAVKQAPSYSDLHPTTDPNNPGNIPNIPAVSVGMESTEQYEAKNLGIFKTLKAGNDGLKSSYFGKKLGEVNPLQIYKEYQDEIKKRNNASTRKVRVDYSGGSAIIRPIDDTTSARQAILNKYKKYGITNILSDDQYKALTSLGYSEKNRVKSDRYSNLLQRFNQLVSQKSSYSTHMTDYSSVNETVLPNINSNKYHVWEVKDDNSRGRMVKANQMGLYSKDNTKGASIADVQYDPEHKGKIKLLMDNGKYYIADPGVFDYNLTRMIQGAESANIHPQAITARIKDFFNTKNLVQSKSSEKALSN